MNDKNYGSIRYLSVNTQLIFVSPYSKVRFRVGKSIFRIGVLYELPKSAINACFEHIYPLKSGETVRK